MKFEVDYGICCPEIAITLEPELVIEALKIEELKKTVNKFNVKAFSIRFEGNKVVLIWPPEEDDESEQPSRDVD